MSYTIDTTARTLTDTVTGTVVLTAADDSNMGDLAKVKAIAEGVLSGNPQLTFSPDQNSYLDKEGNVSLMATGVSSIPKANSLVLQANLLGVTPKGTWDLTPVIGGYTLSENTSYSGGILQRNGLVPNDVHWLSASAVDQVITIGLGPLGFPQKTFKVGFPAAGVDPVQFQSSAVIFTFSRNDSTLRIVAMGSNGQTSLAYSDVPLNVNGDVVLTISGGVATIEGLTSSNILNGLTPSWVIPSESKLVIGDSGSYQGPIPVSSNVANFGGGYAEAPIPVGAINGEVFIISHAGKYHGVDHLVGEYVTITAG